MTDQPVTVASHALDMATYTQLIYGNMIHSTWPNGYPLKGSKTGRWGSYPWQTVPSRRRRNKRERKKGMKRAQFFIRNRMLMPEEIEGIQQGTMEIRRSHILDYENNRMALLYKNRADEINGRRLLEIEEDNWKELTYDIEDPEPKRHFPRV